MLYHQMGCFKAFPLAIHSIDNSNEPSYINNTIHNYIFVEKHFNNPGSPMHHFKLATLLHHLHKKSFRHTQLNTKK